MARLPLLLSSLLIPLAVSNALPDPAILEKRAIPQATPTGAFCDGSGNPVPSAVAPSAVAPSASDLASAVAGCQGVSPVGVTRNDIVDGICKPFTLIFARGTTEQGNIGSIVGPPFVLALQNAFGANNVAVQGVNDYPATTYDYCAGGQTNPAQNELNFTTCADDNFPIGSLSGSRNLAQLVKQTRKQCPHTKLCVSGYSQGAQVVHNAAQILKSDAASMKFINSVVTFGDPDQKLPVGRVPSYKVSVVCHKGDNICQNGDVIKEQHLTYCHDVGTEAAFAKARSKAKN